MRKIAQAAAARPFARQLAEDILAESLDPRDPMCNLVALFNWLKQHGRFVPNPASVQLVKDLESLAASRWAGSCADMSTAAATLGEAAGVPWHSFLVLEDQQGFSNFDHVVPMFAVKADRVSPAELVAADVAESEEIGEVPPGMMPKAALLRSGEFVRIGQGIPGVIPPAVPGARPGREYESPTAPRPFVSPALVRPGLTRIGPGAAATRILAPEPVPGPSGFPGLGRPFTIPTPATPPATPPAPEQAEAPGWLQPGAGSPGVREPLSPTPGGEAPEVLIPEVMPGGPSGAESAPVYVAAAPWPPWALVAAAVGVVLIVRTLGGAK
jgi:hypothetical protein